MSNPLILGIVVDKKWSPFLDSDIGSLIFVHPDIAKIVRFWVQKMGLGTLKSNNGHHFLSPKLVDFTPVSCGHHCGAGFGQIESLKSSKNKEPRSQKSFF